MQQPPSSNRNNQTRQVRLLKNITPLNVKQDIDISSPPFNSKEILSPSDLDSPMRNKKKNSLIPNKKVSDIQIAHSQLNNYIDVLDTKVTKLVEKHQAQFLVAYRNHIKKVRQEMQEIRNKALSNANSTVSQTQKIQALQKQLTVFRQQSLKLFEKVNEKQGTIYNLKTKINQIESQKLHLQKSLRELTRRNKQLQGLNYQTQSKKLMLQSNSGDKQFFISRPQNQQSQKFQLNKTGLTFIRSRPYTTALNSKGASLRSRNNSIQISKQTKNIDRNDLEQQIYIAIDQTLKNKTDHVIIQTLKYKLSQILKNYQPNYNIQKSSIGRQAYSTKQIVAKKQNKSFFDTSKTFAKRSQLQQYFYKSIQTVKKQITRRRGLKSMNFYSQYANLNLAEFKKVDFFRMLQLLLSNDKIVAAVHQKIFQCSKEYL